MFENITHQHSAVLDEIVRARHSVRAFSPISPNQEDVEAIIQAGLLAPFGAFAVAGQSDFRKVFILTHSTAEMEDAKNILKSRITNQANELEKKVGLVPFVQNLKRIAQQGVPGVGSAPYYLVIAERKGMPAVAAQSLCYCLENMWLKATTLGVGLHLVSATTQMDSDPEFCKLLNIPVGEYALDGCALGFPEDEYQPRSVKYPTLKESVRWL